MSFLDVSWNESAALTEIGNDSGSIVATSHSNWIALSISEPALWRAVDPLCWALIVVIIWCPPFDGWRADCEGIRTRNTDRRCPSCWGADCWGRGHLNCEGRIRLLFIGSDHTHGARS